MVMTLSRLVFRSMRKNVKHYYLYFFALIFSVTLCFSFTTLHHNPTVVEALKESGTASAGFQSATYVLYFIVTFFVLYANHLFMKRRSKEMGLYQLIGMTKGLIVRLIALENIILFILAVAVGMVIGFFSSRLFAMILIKLLKLDLVIDLVFSSEAFIQSVIIFSILLLVILFQMTWMVYRVTLLSLFHASKKADERIKRFNFFQMAFGLIGLFLIVYGYYQSSVLFDMEKSHFKDLFLHMIVILASTIFGTFLFFRYSVSFIMNIFRASKKGHLKIRDVMAVTPIMHRMKGNAKSLTLITVLTGLAVGIMSLSYISYFSSATRAHQYSPYDYILLNDKGISFLDRLHQEGIEFEKDTYRVAEVKFDFQDLIGDFANQNLTFASESSMYVVPLSDFKQVSPDAQLNDGEAIVTSYQNMFSEIMPLEKGGDLSVRFNNEEEKVIIKEIQEEFMLSGTVTMASPLLVVTDTTFENISANQSPESFFNYQVGVNLVDNEDSPKAEEIYNELQEERKLVVNGQEYLPLSYEEEHHSYLSIYGTTIFITAFLGLAFLLTTGSILYFKQMSEAEMEKESYTILRKIGFSTSDLMKGIYAKQAFNFGVPLVIGLLHSYFAVKSGWFLFGTEMFTPLVVTMVLYVIMYAVFAVISTQYYKRIIKASL